MSVYLFLFFIFKIRMRFLVLVIDISRGSFNLKSSLLSFVGVLDLYSRS